MAATPHSKLRVLALHSFRTSGAIFKQQIERAKLDAGIGDLVEFVFVDAPHPASGAIPRDVKPYFEGPYYEWVTAEEVGDRIEYDEDKMHSSTIFVERIIREQGPFDGIVGFSQGAIMASCLVAMQRSGAMLQDVNLIKFCVLFAGMKSRYAPHVRAMEGKVRCPSLHIYGDKDAIRKYCCELADAFASPVVLLHPRGHVIPGLEGPQLAVLRAFLQSFLPPGQPPRLAPRL